MTVTTSNPSPLQRSSRKLVAIIAPNILGEDDRQLDTEALQKLLSTYAALTASDEHHNANVVTVEISENFFGRISSTYQIEHGTLEFSSRIVVVPDEATVYLCLSSAQFNRYLSLYAQALSRDTAQAISHLNALTEESVKLKPLLGLLTA